MSATSASSSTTSSSTSPTSSVGAAQAQSGETLVALLAALSVSLIIFGVQMFAFVALKNKFARIFKPKTYLVPERERTEAPPGSPWGWLIAIFQFKDREIIKKCGLDAYFFLRYLQTLLLIFIPLAVVILPILVPLNAIGGKGPDWAVEAGATTSATATVSAVVAVITVTSSTANQNVTGLDILAFGNVRPTETRRYWAHLTLAIVVIIWVCGVFFAELRVYIKVRQDYLTSAEHRLRASATTVLVSSIPRKWLTTEALAGLYDVFPGGIRNIWINRNFDQLLDKIKQRDDIFKKLESAETQLVRDCKKAQMKQLKKDRKKLARRAKVKAPTKEDREQEVQRANAEAERMAQSGGVSSGDPHRVPHTVDEAVEEEEQRSREQDLNGEHEQKRGHEPKHSGTFKIAGMGGGLAAVGQGVGAVGQEIGKGIGKGLGAAGKAGVTVVGGVRNVARDIDGQMEMTHGFMNFDEQSIEDDDFDKYGRYRGRDDTAPYGAGVEQDSSENPSTSIDQSRTQASPVSTQDNAQFESTGRLPGNGVRRLTENYGGDGTNDSNRDNSWWKFWKGPSGGFGSPLPMGLEGDEFPLTKTDGIRPSASIELDKQTRGIWPFTKHSDSPPLEYPIAYNVEYKEDAVGATWEKYLKKKDRPTHRLSRLGLPGFLPGLPIINRKVDTIYWCRGELARLNLEIEMDQKHPERFPLMNSAFIQFNHQVAAHMACQAVAHHIPKHMAPRTVEISPQDVIWDNMSIKWWEAWVRRALILCIVAVVVVLWAVPVAWTASVLQITTLETKYRWLAWLQNINQTVIKAIAGILPTLVITILLILLPRILYELAYLQGAQTGMEKEGAVQNYYFTFLFINVFMVVSISGGALATLGSTAGITNITSIPSTLATQLPKAANYFFEYMILQAMSTSSATLLQLDTLILWFLMPKFFDNTARQKWARNTNLVSISWGSYFPVYTNFACITLVYSTVAPIILLFGIITFTLLWIANRYKMLYVTRFRIDTGGLLYPRAINQTFVGLYIMELCLVGLFFLVRDENDNPACTPQALIMVVAIFLTALYQVLLNMSFGPLFKNLPITFEAEAVLRDQAFERAQALRFRAEGEDDEVTSLAQNDAAQGQGIELANLPSQTVREDKHYKFNPVNLVQGAGSWAARSGRTVLGHGMTDARLIANMSAVRRKRRHRDIEAQAKIRDALYGGYNDEIEDLTPEERDVLVRHAFQHYALRARRPTVWIPRDDLGVSDDEIRRTRGFAGRNLWISNVGAALDGKFRVVYGRNPPDFSEVDLINL